jgi:hypothetical protein
MKKERQGQTQITTKIDGFSSLIPPPPHFGLMLIYFFVSVFSQEMFLELAYKKNKIICFTNYV